MKKFLFLLITVFSIGGLTAIAQVTVPFEGKLSYRSLENHDKGVMDASFGMAYNGARNTTYTIKGNKVLFKDESTHMYTLLDPDNNVITLYSDLINKGMQFDYNIYTKTYLGSFTKEGPSFSVMGNETKNPPTLYDFTSTGVSVDFKGQSADYLKGRIENQTASTVFDIYRTSKYNMPKTMYACQMYGIEVDGLIVKMTWEQTNQAKININISSLGKNVSKRVMKEIKKAAGKQIEASALEELKTYVYTELTNIEECSVDDSEFDIPNNIIIEKSDIIYKDVNKVADLYKENREYLEQHNMHPTLVNQNVVYKIDEEWDF